MYGAYVETTAYSQSWDSHDSMPSIYNDALNWLAADISDSYSSTTAWNNKEVDQSPWSDFVIVCEVSEIEGPKPLFTIPPDVSVDCNKLAERMMSVDYYCGSSNPFVRSSDTQVVLSHVIEGLHALINYFVLYDISARGFVRPVSVAYITKDKNKLLNHFEEIRNGFLEISRYMKFGNRQMFKEELSQYLEDLQMAKDNYCQTCNLENVKKEKTADPIPAVRIPVETILEDTAMDVEPTPKRRVLHVDASLLTLVEGFCFIDTEDGQAPPIPDHLEQEDSEIDELHSDQFPLSPIKELSSQRSVESSMIDHFASSITEAQQLLSSEKPILEDAKVGIILGKVKTKIESQYSKSLYQYIKSFVLAGPIRSPKLLPSKFHLKLSEMRSIFKLCSWGIVVGLDLLISLQKHFQKNPLTLYMDNEGLKFMEPESGLFVLGNHVVGNVMLDSANEVSHYSLPSADCDYPLDTERNLSELRTLFQTIDQKCCKLENDSEEIYHDVMDDSRASPERLLTYSIMEEYEKRFEECDLCQCPDSSDQSVLSESIDNESYFSVDSRRNSEVSMMEQEFSRFSLGRRQSVDVNTISIEAYYNRTKLKPVPVIYGSIMSHVDCLTPDKPGYGIASIFSRFNSFPHVLYSLFIGRTVVIAGSQQNEELVRTVVQALDLFVPSKKRPGSVIPWHTGALDAKELYHIRLVGLCTGEGKIEDQLLPASSLPHVSILGVSKEAYQGPLYSGTSLSPLFRIRRSGWDDMSLIVFLHSLLLSVIANVALNYQRIASEEPVTKSLVYSLFSRTRDLLLSNLQLSKDDANIVKYLTDVQMDENESV